MVVALPPGERKSPPFKAMTAPILAAERALIEAHAPRVDEAEDLPGELGQDPYRRDVAGSAADRLDQSGHGVAVMLLDLDGFKEVNDTLGHHAGDAVLVHVAQCLVRTLDGTATAARLGGDEFAILLDGFRAPCEAEAVAERIHAALADPLMIDGAQVRARASIGIAVAPGDADSASGLLRAADQAMYRVKPSSRGRRVSTPGEAPAGQATDAAPVSRRGVAAADIPAQGGAVVPATPEGSPATGCTS